MNKYDKQHQKNLRVIEQQVDALYREAIDQAAQIGVNLRDFDTSKPFSFSDRAITQRKAEKLVEWLKKGLTETISGGIHTGWALSNQKNDSIADTFFGSGVPNILKRQYYNHNGDAEQAFIERVSNGMSLSDRVWRYSNEFKNEVELGLDLGIRTGRSAEQMSRDLRIYLQHPDKLFHDVRTKMKDDDGNPIWRKSHAAEAYHPGRGVYRSSYKNARRLAVTETNMAYRAADHVRWQQMDFIVGQHVLRSARHDSDAITDICDELSGRNEEDKKGRYPKDFKFTGWHPQCRCFVVPLMMDDDEFMDWQEKKANGEDVSDYHAEEEVKKPNEQFTKWVEANEKRIKDAEKNGTLPNFVNDNRELFPVTQIPKKKTPLEIAEERHAKRTPEQIEDIKRRAAERQERLKEMHRQEVLAQAKARQAARTPEEIEDIKRRAAERQERLREEHRQQVLAEAKERQAARTPEQISDIKRRAGERQERQSKIQKRQSTSHATKTEALQKAKERHVKRPADYIEKMEAKIEERRRRMEVFSRIPEIEYPSRLANASTLEELYSVMYDLGFKQVALAGLPIEQARTVCWNAYRSKEIWKLDDFSLVTRSLPNSNAMASASGTRLSIAKGYIKKGKYDEEGLYGRTVVEVQERYDKKNVILKGQRDRLVKHLNKTDNEKLREIYIRDIAKRDEELAGKGRQKRHNALLSKGSVLENITQHESGHVVYNQIIDDTLRGRNIRIAQAEAKTLDEELKKMFGKYKGDCVWLSTYGTSDRYEFMSECTILYLNKNPNLPTDVAEWFDKLVRLARENGAIPK